MRKTSIPAGAILLPLVLLLAGCGKTTQDPGESASGASGTPDAAASRPASAEAVAALRQSEKELMARPETGAATLRVQHILISFKGAPKISGVTRTREEAEQLAAEVFKKASAGEDFGGLVKEYTNDQFPGIYPMTAASRRGMVRGFGDVGWRLQVGEIGVCPWNATDSPYGWHIIKRLE